MMMLMWSTRMALTVGMAIITTFLGDSMNVTVSDEWNDGGINSYEDAHDCDFDDNRC